MLGPWKCPTCGEVNPRQFIWCGRCDHGKPQALATGAEQMKTPGLAGSGGSPPGGV